MGRMRIPARWAVACSLLAVCVAGQGQSLKNSKELGKKSPTWDMIDTRSRGEMTPALTPTPIPTPREKLMNPDGTPIVDGTLLKDQFQRLLQDSGSHLVLLSREFGKRLVLPNAEEWFQQHFPAPQGQALSAGYSKARLMLQSGDFIDLMDDLRSRKQVMVTAVVVQDASDPRATASQRAALEIMSPKVPLISLRFSREHDPGGFQVHSFAYVDGDFRFLGNMQSLLTAPQKIEPAGPTPAATGNTPPARETPRGPQVRFPGRQPITPTRTPLAAPPKRY